MSTALAGTQMSLDLHPQTCSISLADTSVAPVSQPLWNYKISLIEVGGFRETDSPRQLTSGFFLDFVAGHLTLLGSSQQSVLCVPRRWG